LATEGYFKSCTARGLILLVLTVGALLVLCWSRGWLVLPGRVAVASVPANSSVVIVNVTAQSYEQLRPWIKRPPFGQRAVAPVLDGNRVLVTAELVANATFIELEKADHSRKSPATLEAVDYEANLAVLKCSENDFFSDIQPLSLTPDTKTGSSVSVWQLEHNGTLAVTDGVINNVDVSRYPEENTRLLVYRMSIPLQLRENSPMLPVVRNGRLAGLLMRYDSRSQGAVVVPEPVISHFLKDAAVGSYRGFPRAGLGFSFLRDPQLQHYLKLPADSPGIYISRVLHDGPGDKAGLKQGDVLTDIDGLTIDHEGNYQDGLYGKVSLEHLINTRHYAGDKLTLKVLRDGVPLSLQMVLDHKSADDYTIPPYQYDRQPRYLVVGSLVFVELSRQILREFGPDWGNTAPQKLVYKDAFQDELYPGGKQRVVMISEVLPADSSLGYESLGGSVVTAFNSVPVRRLEDIEQAAAKPLNGFHEIRLEDNPRVIYLDPAQIALEQPKLQTQYRLQVLKNLN